MHIVFLHNWNHITQNVMAFGIHLYLKLTGAVLGVAWKRHEDNGAQGSCKTLYPFNKSTPKILDC